MAEKMTRADLIVEKVSGMEQRTEAAVADMEESIALIKATAEKNLSEHEQFKKEIQYVSAQLESVCVMLTRSIERLSKEVEDLKKQQTPDIDELASLIASKIIIPENEQAYKQAEVDYETLANEIASKVYVPQAVAEEIDYDDLATKIADRLPAPDPISHDYIAARVAEQIVVPNQVAEVDTEALADEVVARLSSAVYEQINSDEIADCVAKRVGSVSPEEFEITVDDEGCDSLAKAIEEKLNYEELAAKISEKMASDYVAMGANESVDPEELALAISDKLNVNATVDEDALAEKAAAILSNYIPEVDNADIADKVIAGIIPAIPAAATIDGDAIADEVSAKILENQNDSDYDIVIDEEGVAVITDNITESMKGELARLNEEQNQKAEGELNAVKEEYSARFDKIDEDVEELKKMLLAGAVVVAAANDETAVAAEEELVEEELVTVSDVIGEEELEEVEEVPEEVIEEIIEETPEEVVEEQDEVIEELISDTDEIPVVVDVTTEGAEENTEGGVDFANMMKYNRSFIARIIQGTDEQKNFYGQVKTALLSYKKVNSNIAWGAERFNKGRETIARFKIRGKTLCLYLALDPKEFEYSVYHQVDVSDNKSMHGTPMMVKIKSPRGVKKAIRLIDAMLAKRDGVKRTVAERDYAAMYPYETIDELIEDGLVKDVSKK